MDPKSLLKLLLEAWGKSALSRFFTSLVVIGAGLLGIGWPDVVAQALDDVFGQRPGTSDLVGVIVGIALIVFGIGGRLVMHVMANRRRERQLALALVGQLRELGRGFADPDIPRDSGYYANKIAETIDAAKEYRAVAPKTFAGARELAGLVNPTWDASKRQPFTNLSVAELTAFADRLEKHYGP